MSYDVLVIGGGPAGLSAALNVRARGRSVLVVTNPPEENPLWRAERVDNYLGMGAVSGAQMLSDMRAQAEAAGVEFLTGRALNASYMMDNWYVSVGSDMYNARAVVLSGGVARGKKFPGEQEFLGRGVSYCATCDGMLYRGKKVAVIGLSADAPEEAEFLRSIGCEVEYFDAARAKKYEIKGGERVEKLVADGKEFDVSCVFILRAGVAPGSLVPGLELDGPHIKVNADMSTSVPGVFAAGDCVGAPYQVAKAAGEGNIAGISAAKYVENIHEEE